MIIRYAEEKNFIELRQFYDGMCKVLSGKDFLPEGDKGCLLYTSDAADE